MVRHIKRTFTLTDGWPLLHKALIRAFVCSRRVGGGGGSQQITFNWSSASDAHSGLDHYSLQVETNNNSLNIQASSDTITTTLTSHTPAANFATGAYTWTVRAHDLVGNISSGVSATFVISDTSTTPDTSVYLPIVIKSQESSENK